MYICKDRDNKSIVFLFNSPLKTHHRRPLKTAFSDYLKLGERNPAKMGGGERWISG
jgi:hypothetical protein